MRLSPPKASEGIWLQVGKDLPLAAKWPVGMTSRRLGEIASTPTHKLVETPAFPHLLERTPPETENDRKRSPRDGQHDAHDDQTACEHSVDDGRGENPYYRYEKLKHLPADDAAFVAPWGKCPEVEAENE